MQIIRKKVENSSKGRQKQLPEAVILYSSSDSQQQIMDKCIQPNSKCSYHYLISKSGEVWQLVDEIDTAWHTPGPMQSNWRLLKQKVNPNLYTIGIWLESAPGEAWSEQIIHRLHQLLSKLVERWDIIVSPETIISPSRLNSSLKPDYKVMDIEIPKLISTLGTQTQDESLEHDEELNELERLRSVITNLELRNAALEQRLGVQPKSEFDNDEFKELLAQNTRLAEEIYILQQDLKGIKSANQDLESKVKAYKQAKPLELYSSKELITGILRKIFS